MAIKTDVELKTRVDAVIKVNGNKEITPPLDNTLRTDLIDSKQNIGAKDATGGYVGMTLFKINFKNALNTFTSFFANANTAARTYTFPDKDITVAGLDDISGSGDFLADGSIPMTGDLDMAGNDILDVVAIKDSSDVSALTPNTRLLKDSLGNTIVTWVSRVTGFGINTNSWTAFLKTTGLTTANRTIELPDADCTLASTDDVADALADAQTYADNLALGLKWKSPVLVGTTANITLSGEQTIDGILTSASRVLVKNQSTATENGIYVSGAGAWSRSSDANSAAELEGAAVIIQKGTVGANLGYTQTADDIVLGVTNLAFAQFAGSAAAFSSLSGVYSDNTSLNNKIVAMDATAAGKQTAFTAQSPNLIYAGPGSGASALPSFRSMVNADLPSGTPKLLPEVGTIITEPWNNITALTSVGGGTFSATGGVLTCTGGTPASIDLTKYLRFSTYGTTNYQSWTQNHTITVGTINATSWGIAFGAKSMAATLVDFQFGVMLDSTNKGHIFLFSGLSNTIIKQTLNPIAVSAGDVIQVKLQRSYHQVTCYIKNTTQGGSVTLTANQNDFNTFVVSNACQFSIHEMGGTHTLTSPSTVVCNQKIGADYLFIGDSRTAGYSSTTPANSYVKMFQNQVSGTVDIYAGSGNRVQDFTASEILLLAPRNIVILAGTNNTAESELIVAGRLQTLITALTGYTLGVNLFYMDELPRTGKNMTLYADQFHTTLGTTGCIYTCYSFLAASATTPNTLLFDEDLIHLNNIGALELSNLLVNQLPVVKSNTPEAHLSIPYFQNNRLRLSNRYLIPTTSMLEVGDETSVSQIRFFSQSSGSGGSLWSNSSNSAWMQGGCYSSSSTIQKATETSGSAVAVNAGGVYFWRFTGATIGNTITAGQQRYSLAIDTSGNWSTGNTLSSVFRNTSAGADVTSYFLIDPAGVLTSGNSFSHDNSANGFGFLRSNGTRRILRWGIALTNNTDTPTGEQSDLIFSATTAGATAAERLRLTAAGGVTLNNTVTAGGTTGAQTINKPSGSVNFAAAASTLVVTNSLVTVNSQVFVQVHGTDATAISARVTLAAGSFTITLNAAATAETKVGFFVIN